jgi:3'-5' exoribonuclease
MSSTVKKIFAVDIRENDKVDTTFLVKYKALQVGKTGKSYLNVVLIDRTGELEARAWDNADEIAQRFEKDDFVVIKGRAQGYQGRVQVNLFDVQACHESKVNLADYLPATSKNIETMFAELRQIVLGMNDHFLRSLLLAFTDDPDLNWRIKAAPAAKTMHHPFIGGLLEHSLSAMKLMKMVAAHYRSEGYHQINEDLLLTGIFLHDIGKTLELNYKRSFDYSDAGKLIGHLVMGVEMVNQRAAKIPGFPEELRLLVNHMIIAHHGELEYGSPKRPKTIEAFIVHQIDDLDAKINSFTAHMNKERENEGAWTSFNKMWDRFLYKRSYTSQPDDAMRPDGAGEQGSPTLSKV